MRHLLLALALILIGVLLWRKSSPQGTAPGPRVAAEEDLETLAAPARLAEVGGGGDSIERLAEVGPAERVALPGESAQPERAFFRGRLIDRRGGEPVPHYELRLSHPAGASATLVTGEGGEFRSLLALPAGRLSLRLVDVEGQASANSSSQTRVSLAHEPPAVRIDVPIEVGPTFSLEMELPPGMTLGDLRASLRLDPPDEHSPIGGRPIQSVVRDGGDAAAGLWVRFRRGLDGVPAWLQVESLDRRWSGGARVPSGRGRHREPIGIVLEPRCSIVGRFKSSAGVHERGGGVLALFRATQSSQDEPLQWGYCDGEGAFRIAGLEPGDYRLEVRDEAVRAMPVNFTLAGGELDLGVLAWQPLALAGRVRLRLRSALDVPIDVQLVRTFDPPRHAAWHSDRWQALPEGGFESSFEWDEVFAGTYAVEVHAHGDVSWHLSLGRLEPPVDDLLFELPAPRPALRFEVTRAEDGGSVDDWSLWIGDREGWSDLGKAPGELESLSFDADTRLAIAAPGRRAWIASADGLQRRDTGDGRIEVRLEAGWSQLFVASLRATARPLEGVEIWLNGAPAGYTDARGELWVHLPSAPMDYEVRHPTLLWAGQDAADLNELVSQLYLRPL